MPTTRPHPPDTASRRIVVRGVNWLGDAVMTTPALRRLRERFPDSEIVLLTHEKLVGLWPGHPSVDRVLSFGSKEGVWSVARRLRAERAGLALLLPNSPRSGLEAWLARIPRRVGGVRPWRDWMLTDIVPAAPGIVVMRKRSEAEIARLVGGSGETAPPPPSSSSSHQVHHYLRLVGHLGGDVAPVAPHLHATPAELGAVRAKFGLDPHTTWIGLNAGAEYGPAKRWPKERFVEAARGLHRRLGCGLAVFGGKADVPLAEEIAAALQVPGPGRRAPVRVLAGRTSLRELCAALAACRVVLTNDTGPMHVAAAVGTPVVVPFGSTSPELTGPGLPGDPRHQLLRTAAPCAPCFLRECPIDLRCMEGITTDRVVDAVMHAVQGAGTTR